MRRLRARRPVRVLASVLVAAGLTVLGPGSIAAGLSAAFIVGLPAAATAGDPPTEDVFRTTAAAVRARYAVGRDELLDRRDEAVAVARAHENDPDPGRRALARLILLRHERPDDCAAWEKLLRQQPGTLEVLAGDGVALLRATWGAPDRPTTRIPRAAVPLVIDRLRDVENIPRASAPETVAQVAGALRAADCAPWLAVLLPPASHGRNEVANALVEIGEPSIAPVRAALDGDPRWGASSAALVLGRLGDRASAPRLLELLATSGSRDLVPACGEALRALAPEEGASAAVRRLASIDPGAVRQSGGDLTYSEMRDTAIASGDLATKAARTLLANDLARSARARIEGVVWELTHADEAKRLYHAIGRDDPERHAWARLDADEASRERFDLLGRRNVWSGYADGAAFDDLPTALVVERAASLGTRGDLVRAARLGTPLAAEVVSDALRNGWARHGDGADALVALAESAPDAALDVLDAWAGPEPPRDLARATEALFLLLDRPRAAEFAERIAAPGGDPAKTPRGSRAGYESASPVAEAVHSVLRGARRLEEILADPSPGVRLAAARALARRGDPAGVPILADAAVEARGAEYAALRDDLVRAGRAPVPGKDDVRRRVLATAVAARIADPPAAAAFLSARRRNQPFTMSHIGLQPEDFDAAGKALAKEAGEHARPLLDERATFLGDTVSIRALGALGGEASIEVLVNAARHHPADAAAALRALGAKGLEAASRVPPPDPEKPHFGGRAARHLGATEAVADTPDGVEKALAGLAEPRPGARDARDEWSSRMKRYLAVAGRSGDARIVGPTLALLASDADDRQLVNAAIEALAHVRDPRVVDACLPLLPAGQFDSDRPDWGPAHETLRAQLGDGLWALLAERFEKAQPGRQHFALAHALFREAFGTARTAADRDVAAAALRAVIAGADPAFARDAAFDLVRLQTGRAADERRPADDAALLAFLRTHADPGLTADEILNLRLPGTAAALLDCYRISRDPRALSSLGTLAYEPAVPDVLAGLRTALSEKSWRNGWTPREFAVLPKLGEPGRAAAREIAAKDESPKVRAAAVRALAAEGDVTMFEPVLALLDAQDAAGVADFDRARALTGLVWLLERMDARRAAEECVRRALTATDATVASFYSVAARGIRNRHPETGAAPR